LNPQKLFDMYGPPYIPQQIIAHLNWLDNQSKPIVIAEEDVSSNFKTHAEKEKQMLRNEILIAPQGPQPTETELQRAHLVRRLRKLRDAKLDQLEIDFGLADDEAPKTFNEFIKRVKSGDISYTGSKDEDYEHLSGVFNHIRWRSPKKKEDKAGFKAAATLLRQKYDAAKDEIIVLDLDKALAALRAFEEATASPAG
jgi:hypothetical protein